MCGPPFLDSPSPNPLRELPGGGVNKNPWAPGAQWPRHTRQGRVACQETGERSGAPTPVRAVRSSEHPAGPRSMESRLAVESKDRPGRARAVLPVHRCRRRLNRVADVAEDLAYLAPNEDEGDDCDDDDESEDECVFGETLALLAPPVAVEHGSNE